MKTFITLTLLAMLVSSPVTADEGFTIPGVPGQDYPVFTEIPEASFDCEQQHSSGYYADPEAQCAVFHLCQQDGRMDSFRCPTGTLFNQQYFVCDWWFNVECATSPTACVGPSSTRRLRNAADRETTGKPCAGNPHARLQRGSCPFSG